jgi:hypothetical protein
MSGGYFDYNQYRIRDITDSIQKLVHSNDDETEDKWGCPKGNHYSHRTIERFTQAVALLKLAEEFAQRVDWLVSGDDGEDSFHARLEEFLHGLSESDVEHLVGLAADLYKAKRNNQ